MTTNNLNFGTDGQGRNAYAPNVSNLIYRALIGQNVAQSITLPSDTGVLDYEVCFSYSAGSNIWVDYSGSPATVPNNAAFATSNSEYCPGQRVLPAGSSLSIITPDSGGAYVGVAIYAKAN
jgi:hypothetical protein